MKNILIACISYYSYDKKYKKDPSGNLVEIEPYTYTSEGISVKAHQTNEACLKFLMMKLRDFGGIDEYICVESTEVKKEPFTLEHIKTSVKNFCNENAGLRSPIITEYALSLAEELEHRFDDVLNSIAQKIQEIAEGDSQINIYLDVAGGKRDSFIFIQLLTKLLSFYGYGIHAYYADITRKNLAGQPISTIVNTDISFDHMKLLDAVNEFVRHGTVVSLRNCFPNLNNDTIRNLLNSMKQFGDSVQLCDTNLTEKLENIKESLNNFEKDINKTDNSNGLFIIKALIPLFRKKFHLDSNEGYPAYISVIEWCLENNLIQQALTIYNENVPGTLIGENFINVIGNQYDENIRNYMNHNRWPRSKAIIAVFNEEALRRAENLTNSNRTDLSSLSGVYHLNARTMPEGFSINYIDTELLKKMLIDFIFVRDIRNKVNHAKTYNQNTNINLYVYGINRDYTFTSFKKKGNKVSINPQGLKNDMKRALRNIKAALSLKAERIKENARF